MKSNSVVSNFIYNVMYQVVKMILPLVTIPYVSRVLRAENLGIYNYTYSVALYFAMFAYLGFENFGNRLIAQNRDDQDKLDRAFSGAYVVQLISSLTAVFGYLIYVFIICRENQLIAFLQILYVSSEIFNVSWLYFGLEKFKRTSTINVIVRILSFIAVFAFVKDQNDLPAYTAICSGTLLFSALPLWCGLKKYVHFVKVPFKDILKYAKECFILFFPVLVINIYRTMDKIMLGNIADMKEVALYANADKIVEVPYGVITALGVVMLPRMTNFVSNGQKELSQKYIRISMEFMMFLASAMAFGMIGVGKVFAPVFFGKEFTASGQLIMIIAPMVIVRACANVVRTQYLLPNKRDKDYIVSILIGVIINLVFNSLMIPIWKSAGAAIATLFAESFVAFYQIFVCRKDISVARYTFENWFFIAAGALMCIPVYLWGESHDYSVLTLVSQIAIGVIIYLAIAGGYLFVREKELIIRFINQKKYGK